MSDYDSEIRRLAAERYRLDQRREAGEVPEAEAKAFEARWAETIARLDELRGTTDSNYLDFRSAFEAGASCEELFAVRNRMHPEDPLKEAADADLRSVGCYSPRHARRTGP